MTHKHFFFIFMSLFLISCLKEEAKTQGALTPFDPDTMPIRWSNSNTVAGLSLKMADVIVNDFAPGDSVNGQNPIEQMMLEWNEATTVYDFFKLPASVTTNKDYSSLSSYKNDGEMGIYRSNSWFSDVSSSALAITQTFGFRRNVGQGNEYVELTHADIIVNYNHFSFGIDGLSTVYDLKTVILHELGHFLGPRHNNNFSSIMYPSLGRGEIKRTLSNFDQANVRSLYGASSLETKTSSQSPGFSQVKRDPREGEEVTTVIELRTHGECLHYENDKLIYRHLSK